MSALSGIALPSLVDLLLRRADEEGARRPFTFLGEEEGEAEALSYAELDRRARRIAVALRERVPARERVMLLYPPGLEYVAGFFGCLYAGRVAVPAYPPDPMRLDRTLPRLRAIIQDARASVVLTTDGILAMTDFFDSSFQEQDNGWRPLASAGLEIHRIPGNHHSILRPPNVDLLARQLQLCLRRLSQQRLLPPSGRQDLLTRPDRNARGSP